MPWTDNAHQSIIATRRAVAHRDLVSASAAATLFGALAAVPALLVAIALTALVIGHERTSRYGSHLATTLPSGFGAGRWVQDLFAAGEHMPILTVVFAVFMASAYGRGLSRALRRFAPDTERELPPSWWSRILTLPLLGLAPLLLLILLLCVPTVSRLQDGHGWLGAAAASYVGLNVVWVITWIPLIWTFRVVAPGRPSGRATIIGAIATGAFVSGFLQGFTLFLALPIDLGRPFGGLHTVGVVSALLLWLWVLHLVVCIGYAFTWCLDQTLAPTPERGKKTVQL